MNTTDLSKFRLRLEGLRTGKKALPSGSITRQPDVDPHISNPAARRSSDSDVSLYDHSRAAIAAALYLYHQENDSLMEDAVRNEASEAFLLVGGDFYGIQSYIFSDSGEARKSRSKILRGRSFAVSLICVLAADMICRAVGLPSTSVLLNAAGKFTIIAPNTERTRCEVAAAEMKINEWLVNVSIGENALGISTVAVAPSDFVAGRFITVYDRLTEAMTRTNTGSSISAGTGAL